MMITRSIWRSRKIIILIDQHHHVFFIIFSITAESHFRVHRLNTKKSISIVRKKQKVRLEKTWSFEKHLTKKLNRFEVCTSYLTKTWSFCNLHELLSDTNATKRIQIQRQRHETIETKMKHDKSNQKLRRMWNECETITSWRIELSQENRLRRFEIFERSSFSCFYRV